MTIGSVKNIWRKKVGLFLAGLSVAFIYGIPSVLAADAAHGHEGGGGGLPQFDPSTYPSQIFWLTITFLVLYVYFARKILPEISSVLENRQAHIRSDLDTAEKLRKEAEEAQSHYETLLGEARLESGRLMAGAAASVKAQAEKETSSLQKKTVQDIAALETRLVAAKQKAMQDMNSIVAEIAVEAARKITGIKTDPGQVKTVVESLNKKEAA